jgi:hypothetical protein
LSVNRTIPWSIPTVTEIIRRSEAVACDTFIGDFSARAAAGRRGRER